MSKLISESLDSFLKESKPMGFERGLDPKAAMDVGYIKKINDWLEEVNQWGTPPTVQKDINHALEKCFYHQRADFVKMIIETFNTFDKNRTLKLCLNYKMPQFMDILIKRGAKFENLPDKAKYILLYDGKLFSFTPEEELKIAINSSDFIKFKQLIEQGVKLTIGLVNNIFKPDFSYYVLMPKFKWDSPEHHAENARIKSESEKMKDYLRSKNLEEIIHPKDLKKLDKIKTYLGTSESVDRKYPHGYKIYRALKWIDTAHPKSVREILQFIYNLGHGDNSYNPVLHGSHWMDGYKALIRPAVNINVDDGTHTLNANGVAKLAKLEKKFGTMKIDPPPYI